VLAHGFIGKDLILGGGGKGGHGVILRWWGEFLGEGEEKWGMARDGRRQALVRRKAD